MADDIVTRLRNYDFMRDGDFPEVIMGDAADEIERLRRAIETFINVYYNRYTTREIESLAIEELKQAVRGE